jgi:hypothetical protein
VDNYNIINIDGRGFDTSKGIFKARLVQKPSMTANSTNVAHLLDFVGDINSRRVCLWIPLEETALAATHETLQARVVEAIRAWIESTEFEFDKLNFLFLDNKLTPYNPRS